MDVSAKAKAIILKDKPYILTTWKDLLHKPKSAYKKYHIDPQIIASEPSHEQG